MAKNLKTDIDEELVRKLATLMDETGLTEIEYGIEGINIRVSKAANYAVAAPALTSAAPVATEIAEVDAASHPGVVKSPMVGVVYTSSDPDSPAFVKVGDTVSEGKTLLLIEAMKVFNPILAPKAGRISQILISGGSPVEFGEPLVIIE
ncbi:MAG: acetyl-CoA carboxylase biotin carboxyl carrier protein [Rhodospirillales bacterium]|jgi:acetyl-CoA carboxylase biotin carboxyl carrier protein|tara:strand:+ start:234 stop:680 length:447 start_codon:yes stop_codon:yes gene_type:complete